MFLTISIPLKLSLMEVMIQTVRMRLIVMVKQRKTRIVNKQIRFDGRGSSISACPLSLFDCFVRGGGGTGVLPRSFTNTFLSPASLSGPALAQCVMDRRNDDD